MRICQKLIRAGERLPDGAALSLRYKLSVISSFNPPKMENRWRYFHAFDFFRSLKKIVMGSIPGAAPVLSFASLTVLGGTIIKIDLFLRLSRHHM